MIFHLETGESNLTQFFDPPFEEDNVEFHTSVFRDENFEIIGLEYIIRYSSRY